MDTIGEYRTNVEVTVELVTPWAGPVIEGGNRTTPLGLNAAVTKVSVEMVGVNSVAVGPRNDVVTVAPPTLTLGANVALPLGINAPVTLTGPVETTGANRVAVGPSVPPVMLTGPTVTVGAKMAVLLMKAVTIPDPVVTIGASMTVLAMVAVVIA